MNWVLQSSHACGSWRIVNEWGLMRIWLENTFYTTRKNYDFKEQNSLNQEVYPLNFDN